MPDLDGVKEVLIKTFQKKKNTCVYIIKASHRHLNANKNMSATSSEAVSGVINWINNNNGFWNHEKLEIKESKLGGIGVFAKEDLESSDPLKPTILLRLHKDSLLSFQKSNVANLLTDEGIDGALALVISFIYEKDQGESSPWYPFIKSINYEHNGQLILPPSLWTKEQKLILQGTELDIMGALDDDENSLAFEKACEFALSQYQASCESIKIPYELQIEGLSGKELLQKYHTFIAISHAVAARDFEIDEYHQVAMVPGACLFNHSDRPSVRFESLFDVCGACGTADGCDHIVEDSDEEEEEGEGCQGGCCGDEHEHEHNDEHSDEAQSGDEEPQDEEMEEEKSSGDEESGSESEEEFEGPIEEFIGIIEAAHQREKEEEAKYKAEEAQASAKTENRILKDDDKPISPDDCVDIVLTRPVKKGEELFNTYGDFNNSVLLSKYGFVIPGNEHNTVSLGLQLLKFKKSNKKAFSRQFEWWENEGFEAMRQYLSTKKNTCEDEDCEDDCCGSEEVEEDIEDVPEWSMEMLLNFKGEPTPITYALLKLLSLNKMEINKLLKNPNKVNLQILTTKSSKALKTLKELVEARLRQYGDLKLNKLIKSTDDRIKTAALLVKDEQMILNNALVFIEKNK